MIFIISFTALIIGISLVTRKSSEEWRTVGYALIIPGGILTAVCGIAGLVMIGVENPYHDRDYVVDNSIETRESPVLLDSNGNYGYSTAEGLTITQDANGIPTTKTYEFYTLVDSDKHVTEIHVAHSPAYGPVVPWPSDRYTHTTIYTDTDKIKVR